MTCYISPEKAESDAKSTRAKMAAQLPLSALLPEAGACHAGKRHIVYRPVNLTHHFFTTQTSKLMRKYTCQMLLIALVALAGCDDDKVSEIVIPAGSVDALAKAIENSEVGGTIRLAAGMHTESGTVTITKQICLVGDDGAVLIVDTKPTVTPGEPLDPAIYIYQAPGACVDNIELRPVDPKGGSGVIIEQSDNTSVRNSKIFQHQYGVVLEASHHVRIENNTIECPGWATSGLPLEVCVMIINGQYANILGNDLSNGFFGAWICDENGTFNNNVVTDNYIGVIPCAVPDSSQVMPRSNVAYTMTPGKNWTIKGNTCKNNERIGILLYDEASLCTVENNDCNNNGNNINGYIDIEIGQAWAANDPASGLQTPFALKAAYNNTVNVGPFPNVRVLDCGNDNVVTGGIQLSKDMHACF